MTTLYRTILVAGFMATASLADIDPQRMQRDIRIMEGVLSNENLYYDVPDGANFRARGLYLDGYGVLFVAAGPASGTERWDKKLSQAELLAATRDLLAEFLGDYAGTIGQLDQDDQITVCYQPKWPPRPAVADTVSFDLSKQVEAIPELRGSRFDFKKLVVAVPDSLKKLHFKFHFSIDDEQITTIAKAREYLQESLEKLAAGGQIDKSLAEAVGEADSPVKAHVRFYNVHSAAIAATVKKSAIDAFREGRIDSATFRQRIAFAEYEDLRKIDIMAGIFDQVLEERDWPHWPWPREITLGMYQPDVGAIFSISDPTPMHIENSLLRRTSAKAKIVEAVADYGATLGQVQSDEHVIVEYRSPFSARSALLKVPKSAIDAYARGDLDLDAFRKKAVWETQ